MKIRELIYTSAQRGLRPGASGFCTVMMTRGLAIPVVELLERLSNNYQVLYLPYDSRARDNPVAFSLIKTRAGSQSLTVLSRICAAGADHTGRSNILAHHLLAEDANPGFGPVDAAFDPSAFITGWSAEPSIRETREIDPFGEEVIVCSLWKQITGSERWAGRLAQTWLGETPSPLYLIYPSGTNTLALLREAVGILPQNRQWSATFATYYCGLPPEVTCQVRCVLKGTPQEAEARRGEFLDLSNLRAPIPAGRWSDRAAGIISVEADARPAISVFEADKPGAFSSVSENPLSNVVPGNAGLISLADEPPPVSSAPIRRSVKTDGANQEDGRFSPVVMARTPLSYVLSPPGWLFWLTVFLMGGCFAMYVLSRSLGEVIREADLGNIKANETTDSKRMDLQNQSEAANPANQKLIEIQLAESRLNELASELESLKCLVDSLASEKDDEVAKNIILVEEIKANKSKVIELKNSLAKLEEKQAAKSEVDRQAWGVIPYLQELEFKYSAEDYFLPATLRGFQFGKVRLMSYFNIDRKLWLKIDDSQEFDIGQESLMWKIKPRKITILNPKFNKNDQNSKEPETIEKIITFSTYLDDLNGRMFGDKKTTLELEVISTDGASRSFVYLNLSFSNAKKKKT